MTNHRTTLAGGIPLIPPCEIPVTPREQQIIEGLAADLSVKMIAHRLNLSSHTVQQHIKNIKQKFGLCTSAGIVALALRQGIIG